jgi:hypothetical protein
MNPSFFTITITDSWFTSNQLGGGGSRVFILRACLNHNGRWLNYRESQSLFARADNARGNAREVFGDTYIKIFPEVDPILYMENEYEYDDENENEYDWQVLNLLGYAPRGIIIRYAPGPWVDLQTLDAIGRNHADDSENTNYPDHWNNIEPHFGFEQLLTPRHFGENESRSVEIVGDGNYYDTFYARHIARTQHNHTWTRFQSIFRGRRARNRHQGEVQHMNHYRAEQAHYRYLNNIREEARQVRQQSRAINRSHNPNDCPHLIDNLKIKF